MISRRRFLRDSLLAGAAFLPGQRALQGTPAAEGQWNAYCDVPAAGHVVAASGARVQAAVEPFAQLLRVPPVLHPVAVDAATDHYEIVQREADVAILPGTTTRAWTYAGEFPGPTIVARRGRQASVTQINHLPAPTTVHLHGGHVPADMDGHPNDLIAPGARKTYLYPNTQPTATLWYHDHVHHATAENVYRGLAGLYLIVDEAEEGLGLPSRDFDVPLVIQDRSFNDDGSLWYPPVAINGFFGDTLLVNGVPQPRFEVAPARYRFRVLNASNARAYRLALSTGRPLVQIATDGGLLPRPVERAAIEVYPAERIEVLVDFSGQAVGSSVVLHNLIGESRMREVMRFDVVDAPTRTTTLPSALRPLQQLPAPSVVRDLTLSFDESRRVWVLDGRRYDPARVDHYPKLGATELWRFNNVSAMTHPMHVHLVMFQVVDRNGTPPEEGDQGWKDTVAVNPGETVSVLAQFTGHTGTYVYHCHNLEHEDHDMMAQMKVVDLPRLAGDSPEGTAAAVSAASFAPGVASVFVTSPDSYADALAVGAVAVRDASPVLFVSGGGLGAATAAELRRLAPASIVVAASPALVPRSVEDELGTYTTGSVTRVTGHSPADTAARISADNYLPGVAVAYVASQRTWVNALLASAAAIADNGPVLLVDRQEVPPATAEELRRLRPARIVVVGDVASVSRGVEAELAALAAGGTTRVAGRSRFDTSSVIAASVADPGEAFVASGASFRDALVALPAAAAAGAPLLLVSPTAVPGPVGDVLRRLQPRRITIVGSATYVSGSTEDSLGDLLPG